VPSGAYALGAGGALSITNGMQIIGTAGAASTTIDAHNASGIVSIAASAGTVSVSGLTFARGEASGGSAISDLGGTLILSEDNFTSDTTGGPGSGGSGAVNVSGAGSKALTVTASTFTGDAAGGEGTAVTSSGQGDGGGISFEATGTLTVTGSTFTGDTAGGNGGAGISSSQGGGGAIDVFGAVTVAIADSNFTGNTAGGNGGSGTSSASGEGGAVETFGDDTVAIADSTFTDNKAGGNGGSGEATAEGDGGAIEFIGKGAEDRLTITGSTFSGDQAGGSSGTGLSGGEGGGGAISTFGKGSVTLTNDTLEGNSVGGPIGATSGAGVAGGGLESDLAATLLNDTLDGNAVIGASGTGGNISTFSASVTLKNTIVAGGAAASGPNCAGTVTSAGHNIEETAPSQCGLSAALGDLIGVNPLLGALQFNGGPTQTQALLPGSPAIKAGDNNGCPPTDQRGVGRPQGPACDIGAYEVAPPGVSTGPAAAVSTSGVTLTGTVSANAADASVYFQIGTSTGYGLQTAIQHTGGVAPMPVSASAGGLSPNTTYHYRIVATSMDGTSVGADATFTTAAIALPIVAVARVATISALSETNAVFTVAASSTPLTGQAAAKRHRKGTVFSFRLDRPAAVKIAIQTTARGRRVRGSCKPDSRKLRHKPRCTRTVTLATLIRSGHAGLNRVAFTGRVGGKSLKPGRYRAVFTATDAAGTSAPQSLGFTIVKR